MNVTKTIAMSAIAATMIGLTGCGGGASSSGTTTATTTTTPAVSTCDTNFIDVVLTGDIASQTLDSTKVYGLNGKVRLTSGSLVIPAGTTIAGCSPASYLLIKPGAQILANGDINNPITFTSQTDIKGLSSAGKTGEWGGLVLLGNAYTDHGVVQYEAGDVDDTFGSTDHLNDAESSGLLRYVLVKHTGYEVELSKELNGLSLGGVGSGTVIEDIAIVGGSDDGMEIWGGRVDVTGLYVTNAKDDSVDTDLGYRGAISNVYVKQNLVDNTNNHDSATIETGNDTEAYPVGDVDATQPIITNFTADIVGTGIYMKNDAGLDLTDAVFRSSKTVDNEMVTYRTLDVVATNAMHATTVCFDNLTLADTNASTFAAANTKDTDANTAFTDWTTNANLKTGFTLDACPDRTATIAAIWKGTAGDNSALE